MSESDGSDATGLALPRVGPRNDPECYQLLEHVDRGGEGSVWKAAEVHDEYSSNRPPSYVALKFFAPGEQLTGHLERRWQASFDALKHARIPGLPAVYGYFKTLEPFGRGGESARSVQCMVMEWISGPNYKGYIEEGRRDVRPLATVAGALDGLAHLGYAHGDLKPVNVKIAIEAHRPPVGTVVDISLLRQITNDRTVVIGTRPWSDPALELDGTYGPLSDLYGFAAMLYFGLTGKPPGAYAGVAAELRLHVRGRAADPGHAVDRIIGALDPDQRTRAQRAGFTAGRLSAWFGDLVMELPVGSEGVQRVVQTIAQVPRVPAPPPMLSPWQSAVARVYYVIAVDNVAYGVLIVLAVIAGLFLGRVLAG